MIVLPIKQRVVALVITLFISLTNIANATIVQIQTSYGNIEINLFDESTPKTVDNFISYIDDNAYDNTIVHRSIKGFISQAGGFYFDANNTLLDVVESANIINEPVYSNVYGTIAMAKLGGNPNSATSQWFINLADNSANLDNQNGGFTVFGQVTEAGMIVIESIADLPTYNFGGAYASIPLQNNDSHSITADNAVIIDTIAITDTATDSASELEPILNTRQNSESTSSSSSSSGAGGLGFLSIFILIGLGLSRGTRQS